MLITRLQIENVRNLATDVLLPGEHLNLISGPNASGKTSLLEAIYILSRGRSFRTPRINEVIRHQQDRLRVTAILKRDDQREVRTGIEKANGKTFIRYNEQSVGKISVQAANLPLVLITPDSHTLVTGNPKQRRHWLDWAMFHVEPSYLDRWKSYHRALRQRNTLIRQGIQANEQLGGWESAMQGEADAMTRCGKQFIQQLQDCVNQLSAEQNMPSTQIVYQAGWPEDNSLARCLGENRYADIRAGYTRSGIHRADINFTRDGKSVAAVCSRGEIKQFVTVLLIAHAHVLRQNLSEKPVVLVDDLASELDRDARSKVVSLLSDLGSQVFITLTHEDQGRFQAGKETMFHVEHGRWIS